ncbi:hypothetical protein [Winogradskyella jejuensis]|uniref:HEPN domain-containing protein n=1 Tax=Winogradskyella jejuensis TaxID=1089305 RepID=A0A1M5UQ44_9FLAO|nr:hypothetical protein [Winogradskyella jejuensis]SHH65006.1 hypothetical protein SAMN05444148_2558 [Winogradskyella jejuensis]
MDYKKTLDEARQFRIAAAICLFEQEERKYYPKIDRWLIIPATVNYALAIELFLKCLLIKEGNHKTGHKLYDLFLELKPKTQEHIIKLTNLPPIILFHVILKAHSNLYDDWRYFYQKKGGNSNRIEFQFLKDFSNALDKTIFDLYG